MFFSFIQSRTRTDTITRRHRLAGAITVDGLPARRLVVIIDRVTLSYVAAVQSDPTTGEWEINGLPEYPERQLLVFSLDNTGTYNAEVADYVSQVATYTPPVE